MQSYSKIHQIRIILVEPAGALNIGSIARVMKNMGLSKLVLVNPQCDYLGEEAYKMAVHAVDVLENAQLVTDLPTALQGCQRAIATTARPRDLSSPLETPRSALPWLITEDIISALIFGPENRGLSNQELNYAQRFVAIPANPIYPSLNLAQAVAVCAYELYQSSLSNNVDNPQTCVNLQTKQLNNIDPVAANNAPLDTLEAYYNDLESLLLDVGYLYSHTAAARMAKLRRLYNRANLTIEETAMLRGTIRQIKWAIENVRSQD